MLAWGVLHLFAGFNVAPYLEVRNGFAYQAINDNWLHVGAPGAFRLPVRHPRSVHQQDRRPAVAAAEGAGRMKFYNLARSTLSAKCSRTSCCRPSARPTTRCPAISRSSSSSSGANGYHTLH